ncbi:MAG: U32 family peptidase, partial [Butyrivibrio sp.]|nr:U32 family peptidase [Butyrivibrio sp.]
MKKVELLSPAGGYETMVGAFNAGADAVYLGGSKFGARAYADNFDRDQVLDAISYAHIHGKKIYMTVNTLIKQKEFGELYDFMVPFAEKKLDGVIVQDYGVMRLIRDEFPGIELHASTQQTVTGVHGARLLKDLGCVRVVPARELSIQEMAAIRKEADIEVEAFIHGAMCYCYSGICLFSSMVGGRSGNRGRCAQPCRLPYEYRGSRGESYPLSLKDMSTIGIIPELIEAGIDSFKIEGRMKKPEYSAGVTALYRKYIDRYYEDPSADFTVSKEDMETLKSLYQRTGISEGYYHKHNGRDMVT